MVFVSFLCLLFFVGLFVLSTLLLLPLPCIFTERRSISNVLRRVVRRMPIGGSHLDIKGSKMKFRKLLVITLLASCASFSGLRAEEILLQDLYAVTPLDNPKDKWNIGSRPGRITAGIVNNVLRVDFQKPVGNAQIIISRDNGQVVKQHDEIDPQQVVMDLNGTPAGRYLLEVYTDAEAVGGMFEVK